MIPNIFAHASEVRIHFFIGVTKYCVSHRFKNCIADLVFPLSLFLIVLCAIQFNDDFFG